MPYQQLTDMDRSAIHALHKADYSQQQIADHVRVKNMHVFLLTHLSGALDLLSGVNNAR